VPPDNPLDILVVEDNESQRTTIVSLIEAAVEGAHVAAVAGGEEALTLLYDHCVHDPPKLILLDLSLAPGSGFDVLDRIRSSDSRAPMARTPVVIFTDSQDSNDIETSYRLGANSYVIKPLGFREFQSTVVALAAYWIACNQTAT